MDGTDPENWYTLERAQEATEEVDELEGVGLGLSPNDAIMGIDLDDCRNKKTGEVSDWAQEFIDEIDTYWEISPSGTGLHGVVIADMDIPQDTVDTVDEEHFEMYQDGQYFTFTADEIEESSGEIRQQGIAVRGLYNKWYDGGSSSSDSSEIDEHDGEYDDIDIAVSDVVEGYPVGEKLSHPIHGSSTGKNFQINDRDEEAGIRADETWRCWNHGCTGNAMHMIGMQEEIISCGDWVGDNEISDDEWEEIFKAARGRGYEVFITSIPDSVETNIEEAYDQYGHWEFTEDDERIWKNVTTFTLDARAFVIDGHGDEHVDLRVYPSSDAEESYDVVVPWTVFNEKRKFKKHVVTGRTTTFTGSSHDLSDIRLIVGHQAADKLQKTTKLGLHDDEIITQDGVLGADEQSHRYVKKNIAMESKFQLEQVEEYDEEEVAQILELLPEVRDAERFYPVIGWWYASMLTPYIRNWDNEIPFLGVFGETGSGKTSTLETLSRMIGMSPEPFSTTSSSKFSHEQHFAATTNIPLWIDEYKPSKMKNWKVDMLHEFIRTATKGGVANSGNPDKSEDSFIFKSPVVVSGEQVIHGGAENRRMIPIKLRKASTEGETEEKWMELVGGTIEDNGEITHYDGHELSEHAPAYWNYILGLDKEMVRSVWRDSKEYAYEIASESGVEDLENLEIVALAMVKFGLAIYQHFADSVGAEPDIENEDIDRSLHYIAGNSGLENRESHLDEFVSFISSAARVNDAEAKTHYAIVNAGKPDEQLCIKLDQVHHAVRKYIREHDISADVFDNHRDYRDRLKEAEKDSDSYVEDTSKVHNDLNRCVAISTEKAAEQVDGFDYKAFER
ncbi:hypothetical protein [Haloarcula laminariae]|uniref:hypothetical protein n=1 Tax=Haloarcula laminariae TaxID=2961577 RepID=UPI0021C5C792|nr:hypothetical protein [Halomicroarcula laminariae]